MHEQVIEYINKSRLSGVNDEQIKQKLLETGWQETDVNELLSSTTQTVPAPRRSNWGLFIAVIIFVVLFGTGILIAISYFSQPSPKESASTTINQAVRTARNVSNNETTQGNGEANTPKTITDPKVELKTVQVYYNPVYKYNVSYPRGYLLIDSESIYFKDYPRARVGDILIGEVTSDLENAQLVQIMFTSDSSNFLTFALYADSIKRDREQSKEKYGTDYQTNDIKIGIDKIPAVQFIIGPTKDPYSQRTSRMYFTYFEINRNYFRVITDDSKPSNLVIYNDILDSISFEK